MGHCLYDSYIFPQSSRLRIIVDLPFLAGKTTIDISDCNYFKALRSSFQMFEILKSQAYFGKNRVSPFIYKILCCIFYSSYAFLCSSVLEVIKQLKPFERRSVSIWVYCLEDILTTHFFLSFMLLVLCVTLFLLISSSNFRV